MTRKRRRFPKGIEIPKENIEGAGGEDLTREGEIGADSDDNKLKVRLDSATRSVVTEDQTQTITNKTIDGTDATGTNTISADASDITYDNSTSGLTATTSQAAIDETDSRLDQDIQDLADHEAEPTGAHAASAISYSNATSGLTATDSQAAIDEVEGRLDTAESDISTNATNHSNHLADAVDAHDASAISYDNATSGLTATDTQAAVDEVEGRLDTAETTLSGKPELTATTDNRIVRTDGSTDIQESGVSINDSDQITGATQIDVGDTRINTAGIQSVAGNQLNYSISSTTGEGHRFSPGIAIANSVNADQTGADVILRISDTGAVSVTNASLSSIAGIVNPETDGYNLTITNRTGNDITIKNDGTVGAGESKIFTGTKKDLTLKDQASITLLYKNTLGFYVVGGTGSEAGQGGINYIENSDAETGTDGWVAYADVAGTEPVDGTGGSPTVTLTQTTSTPLRGDASFLLTKDAADRQGEGVSYDFTIDEADKAKTLSISFDLNSSANLADDDLRVFVYDVTNSNLIRISNENIKTVNSSLNNSFKSFFQTASDSTSYRLIIHVATTNANAYTLKFDNVRVGPINSVNSGSFISDWVNYSPTYTNFSLGNGVEDIKYRRVGENVEVFGKIILGSTSSVSGDFRLTAPPGIVGATGEASGDNPNSDINQQLGDAMLLDSGTARYSGVVRFLDTDLDTFVIRYWDDAAAAVIENNIGSTAPMTWTTGDTISFSATYKVAGWETGILPNEISEGITRITKLSRSNAVTLADNSFTKLPFTSGDVDLDTSAMYNSSLDRIDILETGYYDLNCFMSLADSPFTGRNLIVRFLKNGSSFGFSSDIEVTGQANTFSVKNTMICEYLEAGDYIELQGYQNDQTGSTSEDTVSYGMVIAKRNDLRSQIAPVETVAAIYDTVSGQTLTTTTNTIIDYDNKILDTHNAVTTGASWKFVTPISGLYLVSAQYLLIDSSGTITGDERVDIDILVDGSPVIRRDHRQNGANSPDVSIVRPIQLLAGQEVQVRGFQNSGGSLSLSIGSEFNWISITKVGN